MIDFKEYRDKTEVLRRRLIAGLSIRKKHGLMFDHPVAQRADIEITAANMSALVDLMIAKGLLSHEEVQGAIVRAMEGEVMRQENDLSDHLKKPVSIV